MHRLVQLVVRERLPADEERMWCSVAVAVINDAFPYESNDVRTWGVCARLLPHGLAASSHAEGADAESSAMVRLLSHIGLYLQGRARLVDAGPALRRAQSIGERVYPADHPERATHLINVAGLLRAEGDLAAARPLFDRALRIKEAVYGPDHPDVAIALNNLAELLREHGDLAAARPLYERSLRIREAAYGPDHPSVAIALGNLAGLLRAQGDLVAARPLYERALRIDEAAYGPDHPDVAIDLGNLANLLLDLGDVAAARPLFERSLRIKEVAYGPDHASVAIDLNNLAVLLRKQGDPAATLPLYERSLRIYQAFDRRYQEGVTFYHLATLALARGQIHEAATLFAVTLVIDREIGHRDVERDLRAVRETAESIGLSDEEVEAVIASAEAGYRADRGWGLIEAAFRGEPSDDEGGSDSVQKVEG